MSGNCYAPLYIAVENGNNECVSILLQHMVWIYHCVIVYGIHHYCTVCKGNTNSVSMLLITMQIHRCMIDTKYGDSTPPLVTAFNYGKTECVSLLIDRAAAKSMRGVWEEIPTILHIAVQFGKIDFVRMLLNHGADSSLCDKDGNTPLHKAVYKGNTDGAEASVCTKWQETPLHIAVWYSNTDCLSIYDVDEGTSLYSTGRVYQSDISIDSIYRVFIGNDEAMLPAFGSGTIACVRLLLKHGADTSLSDRDGNTPLHIAVHQDNTMYVIILFDQGAETSLCNSKGISPLHIAADHDYPECVSLLLNHGADTSLRSSHVILSPHIAVCRNFTESVSMLLIHGADTSLCDLGDIHHCI